MRTMTVLGMALLLVGCSAGNDVAGDTAGSGAAAMATTSTSATSTSSPASSAPSGDGSNPMDRPSPTIRSSSAAVPTLAVGSIAEVTVDGLRVRSRPGIYPGSTSTLDAGTRVYLAAGPVTASGYEWYFVSEDPPVFWQPLGCPTPPGDCRFPAVGWVAAGSIDNAWMQTVDAGCPQPPYDFLQIHRLTPLHRLACLAGESITITARIALGGSGWEMPVFEAEPLWLGGLVSPVIIGGDGGAVPIMPVRYAPELGACFPEPVGPSCTLTQFDNQLAEVDLVIDHPASESCRAVTSTTPDEVAVLRCRAQLVMTAVWALGAP